MPEDKAYIDYRKIEDETKIDRKKAAEVHLMRAHREYYEKEVERLREQADYLQGVVRQKISLIKALTEQADRAFSESIKRERDKKALFDLESTLDAHIESILPHG
jgi:hypothetical protein